MNHSLPIPAGIAIAFLLLPWATWALMAWVLRKASGRARLLPLIAFVWMSLAGGMAVAGIFSHFSALPPPMLVFAVIQIAGLVFLAWVQVKAGDLVPVSQAWLVGLQAFRIPTEFLLAAFRPSARGLCVAFPIAAEGLRRARLKAEGEVAIVQQIHH
jgi:hypothetical protein